MKTDDQHFGLIKVMLEVEIPSLFYYPHEFRMGYYFPKKYGVRTFPDANVKFIPLLTDLI